MVELVDVVDASVSKTSAEMHSAALSGPLRRDAIRRGTDRVRKCGLTVEQQPLGSADGRQAK